MASSVLGEWNFVVQWGDMDQPYASKDPLIFNRDGSFTCDPNSGWWIQEEGILFFVFPDTYPPGLVYTANVTRDTLAGIMGYACDANAYDRVPPSGVWWATRPGSPQIPVAEPEAAAGKPVLDLLKGLPKK